MYIKKLNDWESKDWENYFKLFPSIINEDQKRIAKSILTSKTKFEIEENFHVLRLYGIINGVGPSSLNIHARNAISYVFTGVRYEWHDIMFGIGGRTSDFHRANYGLIKYSFITIAKNIQKIMSIDINRAVKLLMLIFTFPFFIIQITIAFFCYIMIEFYGKSAFRFII